jgi:SAM-dependent methyltransferase
VFARRHAVVLEWVGRLGLAPGTRVLEVGCGGGILAVELARRGLHVDAVDRCPPLVDATRQRADAAGVGEQIAARVGDVMRLEYADNSFPVVIAVAVIPWVSSASRALAEMVRVLVPRGHAIVTAANRNRFDMMLDPRRNPHLIPLRRRAANRLATLGLRSRGASLMRYHGLSEFDRLLVASGLEPVAHTTVGFSQFSVFGRPVPERLARALHLGLQRLADRRLPVVRQAGANYMVFTRATTGSRAAASVRPKAK